MSPRGGAGRHIHKPDADREEDIFSAEGEAAAAAAPVAEAKAAEGKAEEKAGKKEEKKK